MHWVPVKQGERNHCCQPACSAWCWGRPYTLGCPCQVTTEISPARCIQKCDWRLVGHLRQSHQWTADDGPDLCQVQPCGCAALEQGGGHLQHTQSLQAEPWQLAAQKINVSLGVQRLNVGQLLRVKGDYGLQAGSAALDKHC